LSREEKIINPGSQYPTALGPKDVRLEICLRLTPEGFRSAGATAGSSASAEQLGNLAMQIYTARRARDRVLAGELFGEPAWDMLLALFCLPSRGERLSLTALSLAANVPQSTGHRWQRILAEHGLIEQLPDQRDGRRQFVSLTDRGRSLLEDYLMRLLRSGTLSGP
jgi:DNA-binding MarR family transcriptional regulator